MHFNSIWEPFDFLTFTHKIPMDTDLLFIIGVMSDIVHSLVLVMNRPSPFPGLSYIDYEFILYIYIYVYIYLWIFKEAKKNLWTSLEIPFPSTPLQSCHWTRISMALVRSKLGIYLLSYNVTPMLTVDIGNYVSLFIN